MGAVAVEANGLLYVGRFVRRESRDRDGGAVSHQVVVSVTWPSGDVQERSILVDAADYDTGEVTAVWSRLGELTEGTPIVLRVRVAPTRDGRRTWMKAVHVEVAYEVPSSAPDRDRMIFSRLTPGLAPAEAATSLRTSAS
jgi:hypothetical protein